MRPRVGYVAMELWQAHREQYAVDGGSSLWRLDPVETAQVEGVTRLGFRRTDPFLLQGVFEDRLSGRAHAWVKALHGDSLYLLELCQPRRRGTDGIWTVERVHEMNTETVGLTGQEPATGYAWLEDEDYHYAQMVLEKGHNPWRRNPLQVARLTGCTRLGFSEQDRFFWRGAYQEAATGRHKAVVWAVHGERVYQIELYQPALQGEEGIWAIEHVMELGTTK